MATQHGLVLAEMAPDTWASVCLPPGQMDAGSIRTADERPAAVLIKAFGHIMWSAAGKDSLPFAGHTR
ncbi:MAG: hypothetical protein MUD11_13410 [Rhodobacteraceae bacterium]|jgi:hypothetical protein|nr:hypothetical protein [Paracoccaceae bacterium]